MMFNVVSIVVEFCIIYRLFLYRVEYRGCFVGVDEIFRGLLVI